ncbi:MAG: phosphoserine phosphatase SerB [Gammaproteobacteria bacterium]|jgi:phosphoserine phosphatase|nr:phosphoserine phosphatase SerB [Gammaproteobacteria bacterium]
MTTLILQGPKLDDTGARHAAELTGGRVEARDGHLRVIADAPLAPQTLHTLRERLPFDINPMPEEFDPAAVRLLLTDMDSTLINIECADELGSFAGVREQVAAITSAAMRGEIDFPTSLRRRLALLKGLESSLLERVYEERLRLNQGAEELVAGLRQRGIKIALVSGGFTFFTERLGRRLNLDYTLANELEIADGRLLGTVRGDIVGAQAKADFLTRLCAELGIATNAAIAVGDGANDLPMLRLSGLGVAYHAKPATQAEADVVLNHSGLDAILAFLDP